MSGVTPPAVASDHESPEAVAAVADAVSEPVVPAVTATAADEVPVFLPAGKEHVFGVVTKPLVAPNGVGVICLHAGPQNLSSHRGATWTRLCRQLAAQGYQTLRMDYHGSGDSSGVLVNRDISGQPALDVGAAVKYLKAHGATSVVIVATCWGGLVALAAASRYKEVTATCLISPPLRLVETGADVVAKGEKKHHQLSRVTRGFFHPKVVRLIMTKGEYRRWLATRARRRVKTEVSRSVKSSVDRASTTAVGRTVQTSAVRVGSSSLARRAATLALRAFESPAVRTVREGIARRTGRSDDEDTARASYARPDAAALLGPLVKRGVPVHVLMGENDRTYKNLMTPGAFPQLAAASSILEVVPSPVSIHGLSTLAAQDTVIKQIHTWLAQDLAAAAKR